MNKTGILLTVILVIISTATFAASTDKDSVLLAVADLQRQIHELQVYVIRSCPEDMVRVGASCVERDLTKSGTWIHAAIACDAKGRRLCDLSQLYLGCLNTSGHLGDGEWTNDGHQFSYLGEPSGCNLSNVVVSGASELESRDGPFRCCI